MRRREIDTRSDVYSLGALLYKLLTGFAPTEPLEPSDQTTNLLQDPMQHAKPIRPSQRVRSLAKLPGANLEQQLGVSQSVLPSWLRKLKGELDFVTMTALETLPQDRYKSAENLASDLLNVVGGHPIQAQKGNRLKKAIQRIARNKIAVTLAIVACFLLVAAKPLFDRMVRPISQADEKVANSEQREIDGVEALRLQSMIWALSEHNLHAISQLRLPKTEYGNYRGRSTIPESIPEKTGSLRKLLESLGSPQPLLELQNNSPVSDISISPDQRYVAAACADRFARIWNLEDGSLVAKLGPHADGVTAVQFSPDGTRLATGDREGVFAIWDFKTAMHHWPNAVDLEQSIYRTPEDVAGIQSLAWSPDTSKIAIGYRYEPIVVRTSNGDFFSRLDYGKTYPRNETLRFTPDGRHLLLVNRMDFRIEKRDFETQEVVWASIPAETVTPHNYPRKIVLNDNRMFHTFADSSFLGQIDPVSGEYIGFVHLDVPFVLDASFSSDNTKLVTAHEQGRIVVSDVADGANMDAVSIDESWIHAAHNIEAGHVSRVEFLEHDRFVTAGNDGRVCLWTLRGLNVEAEYTRTSQTDTIIDASGQIVEFEFSPDKMIMRTVGDLEEGEKSFEVVLPACRFQPNLDTVFFSIALIEFSLIAYHRNKQWLAYPTSDSVEFWDIHNGVKMGSLDIGDMVLQPLSFSSDGQCLVGASEKYIYLWRSTDDWKSNAQIAAIEMATLPEGILGKRIAICDGGRSLLVFCDQTAVLVDTATGETRKTYLYSGLHRTMQFEFSPSGRHLVIMDDHGFRIIDRPSDSIVFESKSLPCVRTQFIDDERILLAQSQPNMIHAWHLPTKTSLGVVYQAERGWEIGNFYMTPESKLVISAFRNENESMQKFISIGY